MGRYVARRLLQMIPVFFGATLLIFLMVNLVPGDPIAARFGDRGVDPGVLQQLRREYGLDRNLFVQYLYYLKGIITLDFGESFSGRPVLELMADAFPITVKLALIAFAFEVAVGLPLGLIAGLRRGGIFDSTTLVSTLIIISIPIFVVGFVLQLFLAVRLGWFSPTANTGELRDLLLPGLVLGSLSVAYVLRLTRSSVAENTRADYVRTATAKGLPRSRVVTVHLLRNSMIPVVTYLGADLGTLMAGAIITEGIFNVPGVGGTILRAVRLGESATVVSFVTVLVLVYLVASLVVDLLYAVLDPRIRYA